MQSPLDRVHDPSLQVTVSVLPSFFDFQFITFPFCLLPYADHRQRNSILASFIGGLKTVEEPRRVVRVDLDSKLGDWHLVRGVEARVHRLAERREVDLAVWASHVVEERLRHLNDAPTTDSAAEQPNLELLERVCEFGRDLRDEVREELVDELF